MSKGDEPTSKDTVLKSKKSSVGTKILQCIGLLIVVSTIYLYKLQPVIDPLEYSLQFPNENAPTFPVLADAEIIFKNRRLLRGAEDITFDAENDVAYTGTADGRIIKLDVGNPYDSIPEVVTNVGEPQKALPYPCGEYNTYDVCGRPLGVHFSDGKLLYADASRGLVQLDYKKKSMDVLAKHVNPYAPGKRPKGGSKSKEPIKLINSIAVAGDGKIYFTLTTRKFTFKDLFLDLFEGQGNGALAVYDPSTGIASIIASNLYFANGIVLVDNDSSAVVAETSRIRLVKIPLTKEARLSMDKSKLSKDHGPDNTSIYIYSDSLPVYPDNLSIDGDSIWVGGVSTHSDHGFSGFPFASFLGKYPKLREIVTKALPRSLLLSLVPYHSSLVRVDAQSGSVSTILTDKLANGNVFMSSFMSLFTTANDTPIKYVAGAKYYKGYIYITFFHPQIGYIARLPWDNKTHKPLIDQNKLSYKEIRENSRAQKIQTRATASDSKEEL